MKQRKTVTRKATPHASARSTAPLPVRDEKRSSSFIDMPVTLRVGKDSVRDGVRVQLLHKDRKKPNALLMGFSLAKDDIQSGTLCFVLYNALRGEMAMLLGNSESKRVVGKRKKVAPQA